MPIPDRMYRAQQEDLITLLALDDEHGKMSPTSTPSTSIATIRRSRSAARYWKQYGKAPGEIISRIWWRISWRRTTASDGRQPRA